MNRDRRSSSHDPTAEPSVAQSTQSNSGLSSDGPGVERNRQLADVVNRSGADTTPRRYEQPADADPEVGRS